MSAGNFVPVLVDGTDGNIYNMSAQPESLLLVIGGVTNVNGGGGGGTNASVSMKRSKSDSEIGARPAIVSLSWSGNPPAGYSATSIVTVPILTQAMRAACAPGATGTYLGEPVSVVSLSPESYV